MTVWRIITIMETCQTIISPLSNVRVDLLTATPALPFPAMPVMK